MRRWSPPLVDGVRTSPVPPHLPSARHRQGLWLNAQDTPQPASRSTAGGARVAAFSRVLRLQVDRTGAQLHRLRQCAKVWPDDLISLGGHREPRSRSRSRLLRFQPVPLQLLRLGGGCRPSRAALIISEDYELGSYRIRISSGWT